MKTETNKRKITVQMWTPLLDKLNDAATKACLNRDAYLEVVFAHEARRLVEDLDGKRNSAAAKAHIKRCFADLKELRQVSFNFNVEVAVALSQACDQVNVWRDAFVNRVIWLLVARSEVIESQFGFEFQNHRDNIFEDGWDINGLLLGPRLPAIGGFVRDDPFLAIRTALRGEFGPGEGLHARPIGRPDKPTPKERPNPKERGLAGFTVYLEDKDVPGSKENKAWQKEMAEMFSLL